MINCDDTSAPVMGTFPIIKLRGHKKVNDDRHRILLVKQIPAYTSIDAIQKLCKTLSGLESVRRSIREDGRVKMYDLFLIFSTPANGFNIVGPTGEKDIVLDHIRFSVIASNIRDPAQYLKENTMDIVTRQSPDIDTTSPDPGSGTLLLNRASFPIPECSWCLQEVDSAKIITPCLTCKNIVCGTCIEGSAQFALRDRVAMPIRCCYRAIHPAVLKGVIAVDMHKQYVSRLEEMKATLPFYCPINTCSEFIPHRKINPVENMIRCPACDEKICFKCRQSADGVHVCSTDPTAKDEILQKFSYKLCPHCGHGQQKLYGCNHVRCPCGTHWCWRCDNYIDLCDCNDYDDQDMPPTPPPQIVADPDMNAETPVDAGSTGGFDAPHLSAPIEDDLDDPNIRVWESEDLDLGEEPNDEIAVLFGCTHDFKPLYRARVPRYWITAHGSDFWDESTSVEDNENKGWERHVECTSCQSDSKITTANVREHYLSYRDMVPGKEREALLNEAQKLSYWCKCCGSVWCRACKHERDRSAKRTVSDEEGERSEYFEDEC